MSHLSARLLRDGSFSREQHRRRRVADAIKDYGDNFDVYRTYFHNFIDLVIVRETTAVRGAAAKKLSLSSSPSPSSAVRIGS
jgi:hypothetical protein